MEAKDKLYLLLYFGKVNETLLGILGTHFKHGIITNFDHAYINNMFDETNLMVI